MEFLIIIGIAYFILGVIACVVVYFSENKYLCRYEDRTLWLYESEMKALGIDIPKD
jgi:hypothetical protein